MAKKRKEEIIIETGSFGESGIWIGVPSSRYDEATSSLSGIRKHIIRFESVEEAEAAIEMLQNEVKRSKSRE
jgi:hypothetical protein